MKVTDALETRYCAAPDQGDKSLYAARPLRRTTGEARASPERRSAEREMTESRRRAVVFQATFSDLLRDCRTAAGSPLGTSQNLLHPLHSRGVFDFF